MQPVAHIDLLHILWVGLFLFINYFVYCFVLFGSFSLVWYGLIDNFRLSEKTKDTILTASVKCLCILVIFLCVAFCKGWFRLIPVP